MSQPINDNAARVWISSITFSDGTQVDFDPDDITVIVGPNNSGKSATLRGINTKFENQSNKSPVIAQLTYKSKGSPEEFEAWITSWAVQQIDQNQGNPIYQAMGHGLHRSDAINSWTNLSNSVHNNLSRWFLLHLGGEQRLTTSNPAPAIQLTSENPSHPIHYLARDDARELQLSDAFKRAFGMDLVVHRNAGGNYPLYVGDRPIPATGEDRVSLTFLKRLELLPKLHEQGDGMRSFASVLLATSVGKETILLIDEPEAFLHPPQARLLGQLITTSTNSNRQTFIATHSSDALKGILASNNERVRVMRIERDGDVNHVKILSNPDIQELWSDSLLKHSNILDGLFHECVVVCESDSDCSFYSAIADATTDQSEKNLDLHFVHCGGKARMPVVLRALVKVGVPVKAICDFDILSEEYPLRTICESLNCPWEEVERDWRIIKSAIDSKRPDRTTAEVKAEIDAVLNAESATIFPKAAKARITSILKLTTAWANAKTVGISYVPPGDASQAIRRLLSRLKSSHIHVVEVGELEGFVRTVPDHGPSWVAEVIQKDLAHDPELAGARNFVSDVVKTQG